MGTLTDRVAAAKAAQREVTVEVRTHDEALAAARALAEYFRRARSCGDELGRAVSLWGVLAADGGNFVTHLEALIARGDRTPADCERMDELDEAWRGCLLDLDSNWGHTKHDVTRALETLGRRDVATAISDEIR